MKTILAILTFLLSTLSYSQYSELSGISLHATGYVTDIEASSEDIIETHQVFNFSFKDKLMTHNILTIEGYDIKPETQFYKIKKVSSIKEKGYIIYSVVVQSGLTKNEYLYNIIILNDGGYVSVNYQNYFYVGIPSFVKTIKK
jgi:hypothetical protein